MYRALLAAPCGRLTVLRTNGLLNDTLVELIVGYAPVLAELVVEWVGTLTQQRDGMIWGVRKLKIEGLGDRVQLGELLLYLPSCAEGTLFISRSADIVISSPEVRGYFCTLLVIRRTVCLKG